MYSSDCLKPQQSESQPPEVSIIIVSYNTRDMTLDCLRTLKAETRLPHEVLVLDNASSDGSVEAIRDAFPEYRVVVSDDNHGFAMGNNLAAKWARGRYLLLLNPDTLVLDGALDTLVAFAKSRPEARVWGGRTLYGDRSLNPTSCWRRMTVWSVFCQCLGLNSLFRNSSVFNFEAYGGWQRDSTRPVDIVTGCFFLIERQFWEQLGGFDPLFTMYGEESDLCLRARQYGARPEVTPDAQIVHYVGASSTVRAQKLVMLLSAKISLVQRHFPRGTRRLGVVLLRTWPASRWLATGFLARATSSERWARAHEGWSEVWQLREDWKNGYRERQTHEKP